jgi:hypothetical protein
MNWFKFSYQLIDGVKKNRQGALLKIYPNPTSNTLHVELAENIYKKENELSIWQLNGTVVRHLQYASLKEVQNINLDGLSAGMYLIEFEVKGELYSNKFLIK